MALQRRFIFICFLCSFISLNDLDLKEEHVLEYMYTYFNNSHYQVAGLLDGELLDFQSSVLESPVPTKEWNKQEQTFGNKMWLESHAVRQDITYSFLSIAEDLKRHMQKSVSDIVQMRLGCRSIVEHNGRNFTREEAIGFAEIAYDGEEKMFFNYKTHLWTKTENAPQTITKKWNLKKTVKDYFTNFLNIKCPVSLDRFWLLEKKNTSDPVVYQVPDSPVNHGMVNLTCLVTGFYPRSAHIKMNLVRDGVLLTEEGVWSSGVRPNEDHTYQLRKTLSINASLSGVYRYEVHYESFPKPKICSWELKGHKEGSNPWFIGLPVGFILVLFLLIICGLIFFRKRNSPGDTNVGNIHVKGEDNQKNQVEMSIIVKPEKEESEDEGISLGQGSQATSCYSVLLNSTELSESSMTDDS